MNQPDLTWTDDDVPVSRLFDDPYFTGGLDETRHVFLHGNGLPGRFRDGFQVAELGFGTGLNLLAVVEAWTGDGTVHFTAFEAYPISAQAMARALAPFALPSAAELVSQWAHQDGSVRCLTLPGVSAEVHIGDARDRLPSWPFVADAWFLDGFAPARNPELWGDELMRQVARHTAPGGTAATYTAAGHVRRGLEAAGFTVTRAPGFGRKKHMTIARKPE